MAFQGLGGDVFNVVDCFAQDLFGGGGDGDIVALDFDLGDAVHLHRDAFAGVNLGGLDINGEQLKGEDIDFFDDRDDERAAALDDAEAACADSAIRLGVFAFPAGDDDYLVWPDLGVAAGPDGGEKEEDDDNCHCGNNLNTGGGDGGKEVSKNNRDHRFLYGVLRNKVGSDN